MYVGMIALVVVSILVLFGVGQRVLDKLRLTDRQALLFAALIIAGGFVPEIPPDGYVRVNIGGFLVPLALCVYLFVKAEGAKEYWRAIGASIGTAIAVWLVGRFFPNEPETMPFDVNYLYGVVAGVVACVLGRSRRSAFIGGILGVALADIAQAVINWNNGIEQPLVLGGAGAFDMIVLSGLLAVLLRELVGELEERATRKTGEPERAFADGNIEPEVLGEHRDDDWQVVEDGQDDDVLDIEDEEGLDDLSKMDGKDGPDGSNDRAEDRKHE